MLEAKDGKIYFNSRPVTNPELLGFVLLDLAEEGDFKISVSHQAVSEIQP